MGMRPGLFIAVAASLSIILPGSYQFPQNVVFQPVTYQLTSMGQIQPDLSLTFPPSIRSSSEASEATSNQLICKKIEHGDGLVRVSPSTHESQLFFFPSSVMPLSDGPFSRFLVAAVSSIPAMGVSADVPQSEVPEGAFAAPPPLMASLCVSQDSPRPFPVLFAPPPPSQLNSLDNDFRKDIFIKPFNAPFYFSPIAGIENPLKVNQNAPSMEGMTIGIHGVPATIESSSPSKEDPSGRVVLKLHTNPPGSITIGFTAGGFMAGSPEELDTESNTYRGHGLLTDSIPPSVSLVFKKPVESIGIGSTHSPAVTIEKQNILTSAEKIPKYTVI